MSDSVRTGSRLVVWLFAAIGLIAALAIIYIAAMVFSFTVRNRQDPAQIEAKAAKQVFAVAGVNALAGTDLNEIVIATDASIQGRGDPYSSGGSRPDERNVILLDKANGESRKLLPDNGRQIVERLYLPAVAGPTDEDADNFVVSEAGAKDGEAKKTKPPVAYYLMQVRAAEGQSRDVLIGNLATGQQAFVLKGIDGVDRIWMQSPTRVALLLRQGRKLQYRAIEIPQLKVVVAHPVEID
ncbi:hypothetical protein [Sphingomonas sp. KR3-1]|uniref:hypothetical protein n=1 Tax=Sphingomonas sp. KR3-1 TaxID=3156611 RepID=UPI0032B56E01